MLHQGVGSDITAYHLGSRVFHMLGLLAGLSGPLSLKTVLRLTTGWDASFYAQYGGVLRLSP
jgi:hypothetical protein